MSKKTFADHLREGRRLALLRLLNEQPGKRSNSAVLHSGLFYLKVVAETHEVIEDLRFLQVHQLVDIEQLGDIKNTLYGVHLRARGIDLVNGLIEVDGVSPARRD